MVKYILFGAFVIFMFFGVVLCRVWLTKKSELRIGGKNRKNFIRQPIVYLYIGIGGLIIFLSLGLFFLLAPEKMISQYEDGIRIPAFCVFMIICLPYLGFILFQMNWKIEILKHGFIFSNFFRKKRFYNYEEIELKTTNRCIQCYNKGKRVVGISYGQPNLDLFLQSINQFN